MSPVPDRNPVHRIIDLLLARRDALDRVHHADTKEATDEAITEWRACSAAFWGEAKSADDAIRGLADPAKGWLAHTDSRFTKEADLDLIEEAAHALYRLAIGRPMSMPEIYSTADQTREKLYAQWVSQGDRLLKLGELIARLLDLAARAKCRWHSPNTAANLLFDPLECAPPEIPQADSLAPDVLAKLQEIHRAAATLCRVSTGWLSWLATWGPRIEALPADDNAKGATPPEQGAGMTYPMRAAQATRLAIGTLYGHRCLPPSLRKMTPEDALRLFPQYPRGAISPDKDRLFVETVRQSIPAIESLRGELSILLEQLSYAPLAVLETVKSLTGETDRNSESNDNHSPEGPPSAATGTDRASSTTGQAEGSSVESLPPSRRKALSQYRDALSRCSTLNGAPDREVYEWLQEHWDGDPLLTFATWSRYLREARNATGTSKNAPRAGRDGRSIVRPDEI